MTKEPRLATFEVKKGNGGLTFIVTGELDVSNSEEFHQIFHTCYEPGDKHVTFNLSGVKFFDCSAFRALLICLKTIGQKPIQIFHRAKVISTFKQFLIENFQTLDLHHHEPSNPN